MMQITATVLRDRTGRYEIEDVTRLVRALGPDKSRDVDAHQL